jgi:hypothetical protein
MENPGDGRPTFLGPSCPGPQQAGAPFRIDDSPLPSGYDPHAFPEADVIAGGTGSAALDRRLLRTLYRHWRFAPAEGGPAVRGLQRIRLNSIAGRTPLAELGRETPSL